MVPSILFEGMLVMVLGIGSQWVAWRFRMPAIVVMSVTGLLIGPIFGWINPEADFGELYNPIISAAVAVILFEGSLNLSFKELRGLGKPVFRISTIGAFIAWILGSLTAHYIAGLTWAVAFVIGGLFIVTGPTVIMPLLRQSKLKPRAAKILKWEGIMVDPIGALLAVFAFEIITYITATNPDGTGLVLFFAASLFAALLGGFFGYGVGWMFESGHIPEFLKSPAVFVVVIFSFTLADTMMDETGLLAVTAMGMTLANMNLNSVADMRHFKENISILLISAIFIMLTASLKVDVLLHILNPHIIGYVLLMMFVVRPISIFLSTMGTALSLNEKALVAWIAPRGIVALTVSGYFASILSDAGYADASLITTLTFGLVFFTVVAHGFSISWLARLLHLSMEGRPGVLIIGSNPFTVELAKTFIQKKTPVIIVDSSWEDLEPAQEAGIPFYHGDMLSEQTEYNLDTIPYDYLIAATEYDSYNALVCTTFMPEYGRTNVFRLSPYTDIEAKTGDAVAKIGGRILFHEDISLTGLVEKLEEGYSFTQIPITARYRYRQYLQEKDARSIFLYTIKQSGRLRFYTEESVPNPEAGDTVVSLLPPQEEEETGEEELDTKQDMTGE